MVVGGGGGIFIHLFQEGLISCCFKHNTTISSVVGRMITK